MNLSKEFVRDMVAANVLSVLCKDNLIPVFMQKDNIKRAYEWTDLIEKSGNLEAYFMRMRLGAL